ncbi:MAG: hypothetical protein ACOCVQ_01315 [Bacillota bacterium]
MRGTSFYRVVMPRLRRRMQKDCRAESGFYQPSPEASLQTSKPGTFFL